jgi:hypothetical protein
VGSCSPFEGLVLCTVRVLSPAGQAKRVIKRPDPTTPVNGQSRAVSSWPYRICESYARARTVPYARLESVCGLLVRRLRQVSTSWPPIGHWHTWRSQQPARGYLLLGRKLRERYYDASQLVAVEAVKASGISMEQKFVIITINELQMR